MCYSCVCCRAVKWNQLAKDLLAALGAMPRTHVAAILILTLRYEGKDLGFIPAEKWDPAVYREATLADLEEYAGAGAWAAIDVMAYIFCGHLRYSVANKYDNNKVSTI